MTQNGQYNEYLQAKIDESIEILKLGAKMSELYYQKPLIITYSGGKDSDVMLRLAEISGINFEVLNSHTTVDAPETVYHIREVFKELESKGIHAEIHMPTYKGKPVTMWTLIPQKGMPPTNMARYCCEILKETSTPNRMVALGVRKAESTKRRNREAFENHRENGSPMKARNTFERMREVFEESEKHREETGANPNDYDVWDCKLIEDAKKKKDTLVNPIISWTDTDVWTFIRGEEIKYNPLYDMGYSRVGCVGCPLGGRQSMLQQFADYPKYRDAYIRAFDRLIRQLHNEGRKCSWEDGEDCFRWWVRDKNIKGQMSIDDFMSEDEK